MVDSQQIYREVGRNIKRYRRSVFMTQAQLSVEIGISRSSLANIEAGRQQLLVHHLYAIADALDLDSPKALLPSRPALTLRKGKLSALPLPEKGLSDKQRQEVLRLIGGPE